MTSHEFSVLVCSDEYPPKVWGGMSRSVEGIVLGLSDLNVRVDVVTHHRKPEPDDTIIKSGESGKTVFWCPYPLPLPETIARQLNITQYDLLYINGRGFAQFGKYAKYVYGLRVLYSSRSNYYKEAELNLIQLNPGKALLQDINLSTADSVVIASQSELKSLVHNYPEIANKSVVIPNPLHPVFNTPYDGVLHKKKQVLFIGRFIKQKGIDYLVSAIPWILKDDNDIIIKFVGGHGESQITDQLIDLCERFPNRVLLENWLDIHQVKAEYLSSSFLIMPSLYEPFGNCAIEAMSCACPVVAFPTGGLSEIIEDGVTGVLVDDYSASSLGERIGFLLSGDQVLLQKLGLAACKDVMAKYDYRLVSKMYFDVMRKIL